MWQLLSSVFLGWSLGSNDAANVFGTAVAARMVRFWTAAVLCSVFVLIGAVAEGYEGFATYARLSATSMDLAFVSTLCAGVTVTLMSVLGVPVSSSQAVVGALVVAGFRHGSLDTSALIKVALCWVATPLFAMAVTVLFYYSLGKLMNRLALNVFSYDSLLRAGLVLAGCYGSYALGANNVANVTGPFVHPGGLSPFEGALIGGLSIGLGVMTFSKKVMLTVGKDIVKLDAFTAFIAVLSEAITVHVFAIIGVPVSTSQAVVGAVVGVGFVKGLRLIKMRTVGKVVSGWLATPVVSGGLAFAALTLWDAFSGVR
jgi:PiT family inorganic phosphate transporter